MATLASTSTCPRCAGRILRFSGGPACVACGYEPRVHADACRDGSGRRRCTRCTGVLDLDARHATCAWCRGIEV
jgi:hypothetical protein